MSDKHAPNPGAEALKRAFSKDELAKQLVALRNVNKEHLEEIERMRGDIQALHKLKAENHSLRYDLDMAKGKALLQEKEKIAAAKEELVINPRERTVKGETIIDLMTYVLSREHPGIQSGRDISRISLVRYSETYQKGAGEVFSIVPGSTYVMRSWATPRAAVRAVMNSNALCTASRALSQQLHAFNGEGDHITITRETAEQLNEALASIRRQI